MSYLYTRPSQMTPLLPGERAIKPLLEKAALVIIEANKLHEQVPSELSKLLAKALKPVNAYYSNKIEGLHTSPELTLAALHHRYHENPDIAFRQRLAAAHVEAENWGETALPSYKGEQFFDPVFVHGIYQHLFAFSQTSQPMDSSLGSGTQDAVGMAIEAYEYRSQQVKVGDHIPPQSEFIPAFLEFWSRGYKQTSSKEHALIGLFASHHRLAWIHPYVDGNGRTCRLHTHIGLHALGLTKGLWAISRGFALTQDAYYRHLALADQHRQGDIDGRGNLSEKGLVQFIGYCLDVCLEQIQLMSNLLSPVNFGDQLNYVLARANTFADSVEIEKAYLPLMHLTVFSEMARAEFKAMLMAADPAAEQMLKRLLEIGLLVSATTDGPVSLSLPVSQWRDLLTSLWAE